MLTPEQITALGDAAANIAVPITEYLIKDIARRVSEAGQLTSTAAYQIWRAQNLGISQKKIREMLRRELKVSHKELRSLLRQSAEVGYNFDIRHLSRAAVPFAENAVMQQMVRAAVKLAKKDFTNLTQTLGMVAPNGKAYPLTKVYQKTCEFAFEQVFTGAADYNTAIRQATKNIADYGVRTIDYESGISTSLEAAVRRNIMGGMGLMQQQISQSNHDAFGADGWEISAHAGSAPDHEPHQGRQYTDAEYTALNSILARPIGTLNCGHAAFPIILGVNEPQYSKAELAQMQQQNKQGITYQGKQYTMYEATQKQRQIERVMRKQKNRILISEADGDEDLLQISQIRLGRLKEEYARFSKAAGLPMQQERIWVAGFGKGQAGLVLSTSEMKAKQAAILERNLLFIRNDAKIKQTSGLDKKLSLPDEIIKATVPVDLPSLKGIVPKGSMATNVYAMAGDGTCTPIRDLRRLYKTYPHAGDAAGWQKKSGDVISSNYKYVVHWYENNGFVVADEIKLKGVGKP